MRRSVPVSVALFMASAIVGLPGQSEKTMQVGTAKGTISGRILHADGTPAVALGIGAVPRADVGADSLPASLLEQSTRTDGAGNYRLENLPPGRYYVAVGDVWYGRSPTSVSLHAPVFSPGNSAPVAVEVAGSAAVDVSFRLPPTPPSPTPVYRISGKIIFGGRANPGPFGPGGERVFLFRGKDCGPRNNAQPAAYGTAGVDAYEIRNVPPGAYAACFMRGSDVIIGTGWYGPFNLEVADKDITVDFDLTQPDKRGLPNPPARGARG